MSRTAEESNSSELHPAVRIGHVHLRVSDLDRATSFYRDVLGFDVTVYGSDHEHDFLSAGGYHHHIALNTWHSKGGHTATGGAHGTAALRHPLPRSARTRQSRRAPLGERLSDQERGGSWVSVSVYLSDPDGNGVELYYDRPRKEWFDSRGNPNMKAEPFDPRDLLVESSPTS